MPASDAPPGNDQRVTTKEYVAAMRSLAAAVNVITMCDGDGRYGLTATAVCSLTADPPTVLVCVNQSSTSHRIIRNGGRFAVNILSERDVEVARSFASRSVDRFTVGEWDRCQRSGNPRLRSALLTLDCELNGDIPFSTHSIFLGTVVGIARGAGIGPLVYEDGHYRRLESAG